jgi:hypothetical protein
MVNNKNPHTQSDIYQNQEKSRKTKNALGGLRQDKRGGFSARRPSTQPARTKTPQRAETSDKKSDRIQNTTVDNSRTVQLSIWDKPIDKAEIQRLVDQGHKEGNDKITASSVAATLLERAVQGHIDMQYGALLEPVFQHLFDRRMAARDNRLALLLVRNYLVAEQTRGLATYLASRQPDMTPDILEAVRKLVPNKSIS